MQPYYDLVQVVYGCAWFVVAICCSVMHLDAFLAQ